MDYAMIEAKMMETYAAVAPRYRKNDDQDADGPDHQRIGGILAAQCCSFQRPISVLDLGCGTGRYFHCLKGVRKLVGMDVSDEMLEQAQHPVRGDEVSVSDIKLIRGNFYTAEFPEGSFDFIYSLGVFGNGCGLTVDLFNKFHRWLTPDGRLFLDAIDSTDTPLAFRIRRQTKRIIYGMLPHRLQNVWDRRTGWLPFFLTSQRHLQKMLRRTKFPYYTVESNFCSLPLGVGRKVECLAWKSKTPLHSTFVQSE